MRNIVTVTLDVSEMYFDVTSLILHAHNNRLICIRISISDHILMATTTGEYTFSNLST